MTGLNPELSTSKFCKLGSFYLLNHTNIGSHLHKKTSPKSLYEQI